MGRIKICGLQRMEDIEYVNECKPDYVGFVFAESRRKVTREQAKKLKEHLNSNIIAVGVFVNEDVKEVAQLVNEGIIDMVQLHGDETNEYIETLRKLVGNTKIIKAIRVAKKEDITRCEEIVADYLLFDSLVLETYGGTGKTFDWELVKTIKKPFFLAGGINSENVTKALALNNVFAIDVSSAVETAGYKDRKKIRDMVAKVAGYKGGNVYE